MNNKRNLYLPCFLFILAFIFLNGCESKNPDVENQELSFDIDSTKLGEKILFENYNFTLFAPQNYKKLDSLTLLMVKESITRTIKPEDNYQIEPLSIHKDDSTKSSLLISRIIFKNKSVQLKENADIFFKNLISKVDSSTITKIGEYTKGGTKIHQLLLSSNISVIFKLLFENNKKEIFTIDYIIPRADYIKELKSIESSIGTITINKNKKGEPL